VPRAAQGGQHLIRNPWPGHLQRWGDPELISAPTTGSTTRTRTARTGILVRTFANDGACRGRLVLPHPGRFRRRDQRAGHRLAPRRSVGRAPVPSRPSCRGAGDRDIRGRTWEIYVSLKPARAIDEDGLPRSAGRSRPYRQRSRGEEASGIVHDMPKDGRVINAPGHRRCPTSSDVCDVTGGGDAGHPEIVDRSGPRSGGRRSPTVSAGDLT